MDYPCTMEPCQLLAYLACKAWIPVNDVSELVGMAVKTHPRMIIIPSIMKDQNIPQIIRILKDEGYVEDFSVEDDNRQGKITIQLKYQPGGERTIADAMKLLK